MRPRQLIEVNQICRLLVFPPIDSGVIPGVLGRIILIGLRIKTLVVLSKSKVRLDFETLGLNYRGKRRDLIFYRKVTHGVVLLNFEIKRDRTHLMSSTDF